KVLRGLLPDQTLDPTDEVRVRFEYTPTLANTWLGETGQPTQIDVYIEIKRGQRPLGHLLIEVKYSESSFGMCRGWNKKVGGQFQNPDRTRCENVAKVIDEPTAGCWLAQVERRKYWNLMGKSSSSLQISAIRQSEKCPFRYGIYQMMR